MVQVQTGNMLDVVVEGKSIGLKQRNSDHRIYDVIWLPDPEALALVLLAEIKRLRPDSVESKGDRFQAGADARARECAEIAEAKATEYRSEVSNGGSRFWAARARAAGAIADQLRARVGQPVDSSKLKD